MDHALDYTSSGWEKGVPPLDIVMDAIGGASFRRSYTMLRAGGRLVCFGASAVMSGEKRNLLTAARAALRMPRFNLIKQMSDSKSVIGLNALTLWDELGSLEPYMGAHRGDGGRRHGASRWWRRASRSSALPRPTGSWASAATWARSCSRPEREERGRWLTSTRPARS